MHATRQANWFSTLRRFATCDCVRSETVVFDFLFAVFCADPTAFRMIFFSLFLRYLCTFLGFFSIPRLLSSLQRLHYYGYTVYQWDLWNKPDVRGRWRVMQPPSAQFTQKLRSVQSTLKVRSSGWAIATASRRSSASNVRGPFPSPHVFVEGSVIGWKKEYKCHR